MRLEDTEDSGFLTGKLLVATPLIQESCFARSLIYVVAHDDTGAMGIVVNHVINNAHYSLIFKHLEIDYSGLRQDLPIHFGGPVESARGFVLHTRDYNENVLEVKTPLALSSNIQILKEIALGKGPSRSMFALGYTGWEAGQLDAEVKSNTWMPISATDDLIFDDDNYNKWQRAAASIGVNVYNYSPYVGNA